MFECKLHSSETQTAFGPLCLLGHYLTKEGVLEPLFGVEIAQKTVEHSPAHKLIDALVGILSGCKALYEMNVRVRPDLPVGRAFGRERVADQSTIQRTLKRLYRAQRGPVARGCGVHPPHKLPDLLAPL